jgi:hypothetical protein
MPDGWGKVDVALIVMGHDCQVSLSALYYRLSSLAASRQSWSAGCRNDMGNAFSTICQPMKARLASEGGNPEETLAALGEPCE